MKTAHTTSTSSRNAKCDGEIRKTGHKNKGEIERFLFDIFLRWWVFFLESVNGTRTLIKRDPFKSLNSIVWGSEVRGQSWRSNCSPSITTAECRAPKNEKRKTAELAVGQPTDQADQTDRYKRRLPKSEIRNPTYTIANPDPNQNPVFPLQRALRATVEQQLLENRLEAAWLSPRVEPVPLGWTASVDGVATSEWSRHIWRQLWRVSFAGWRERD